MLATPDIAGMTFQLRSFEPNTISIHSGTATATQWRTEWNGTAVSLVSPGGSGIQTIIELVPDARPEYRYVPTGTVSGKLIEVAVFAVGDVQRVWPYEEPPLEPHYLGLSSRMWE